MNIRPIKFALTLFLVISPIYGASAASTSSVAEQASNTQSTPSSDARIHQRELLSATLENDLLTLELTDALVHITAINKGTVEVVYKAPNTYLLPSFALPHDHNIFSDGQLTSAENGYVFSLPDLQITIQASPFKLIFNDKKGELTSEEIGFFQYETIRGFRFNLSEDEALLGGGQRILGMDRRGHRMPLYNKAHYGYNGQSNQMYYSLPAVMSDKRYAIAFDNSANGFLDIGHTEKDILQFEADAGRTSYIFSAGNNYYDLIENFVSATGKQPLPPRWALGNYASRFGYKTQQEVLDTINGFIDKDFPVDAVVLDLYWFGPDIKGHMGNLNWDVNNWPEPEQMISTLKDKGVKTIMITEPFILSSSSQWASALNSNALAKNQAGKPRRFDFYFGNTGLVDVFDNKAQDWFWQYYANLNEQGVAGWWGDLGEPEVHPADSLHIMGDQFGDEHAGKVVTANEVHNAYGHQWAKMVYERQRKARPNERPFVMMRAGTIGTQRYGMIPWTGDVDRSWNGLKPQVELALQMSMFGLAYTHSDLGGFAGGETFDPELYTRWMQYGVFQPVYRPHAQDHIPPEPIFHDEKTQDIVRDFVKLRYRLLPYNYSLSMQNSLNGIPMMRPLFMDFPDQDIERTNAYMWGDAFLVAPIVNPGLASKDIMLPEGQWFDFFSSQQYEGGQTITVKTPLSSLPVFVKAGSFVPSVSNMQNTNEYSSKDLRVDFYPDFLSQSSSYTMFEDNGIDPLSISENRFQRLNFTSKYSVSNDTAMTIELEVKGSYDSAPSKRNISFVIHGINQLPDSVLVNNKPLTMMTSLENVERNNSAFFDKLNKQLHIRVEVVDRVSIGIN